jgi:ribosome-associated protein
MAENVVVMDMSRVSGLCDYFVICSATSNIRAKTIAEFIKLEMKKMGHAAVRVDGLREGKWVVLDFADIIVHIFQSETREYYNLEQLWGDAPKRLLDKTKDIKNKKS